MTEWSHLCCGVVILDDFHSRKVYAMDHLLLVLGLIVVRSPRNVLLSNSAMCLFTSLTEKMTSTWQCLALIIKTQQQNGHIFKWCSFLIQNTHTKKIASSKKKSSKYPFNTNAWPAGKLMNYHVSGGLQSQICHYIFVVVWLWIIRRKT